MSLIREYEASDLERVLAVWEQISASTDGFVCDSFFDGKQALIPDICLSVGDTWVYEREGELLGLITLYGAEIAALVVHPDNHNEGIGTALMSFALAMHDELEVAVFEKNETVRQFYAKLGFERFFRYEVAATGEELLWLRAN